MNRAREQEQKPKVVVVGRKPKGVAKPKVVGRKPKGK